MASKSRTVRAIYMVIGSISLVIGCAGIILPFLPGFPFFLLTLFCYGRGSEKLKVWFLGTSMYRKHLEAYLKKKGMTWKTKLWMSFTLTFLFGFGFLMMHRVPVARYILLFIWACHIVYFIWGVKTLTAQEAAEQEMRFAREREQELAEARTKLAEKEIEEK